MSPSGELVEIGGSFRVPEIMEQSGCHLKEVGTTNKTKMADYRNAYDPERDRCPYEGAYKQLPDSWLHARR